MARIARRLFQSWTLVGVALLRTVTAGYGSFPAGSLFQDQLLVDLDDQIRTGVSSIQARSSSYGGGIGGCSDAFSVFGFLAFLLALLDLIMDLQGNANAGGGGGDGGGGDGGRRRRDLPPGYAAEPELVEASLASYAMLRAFVNALHTDDEQCGQRFLCEGASEAAGLGEVGRVVARVASHNAVGWLRQRAVSSGWPLPASVTVTPAGTSSGTCHQRYNCSRLPHEYRYPNSGGGVRAGPLIDVNYRPVLQFVSETVRRYL